MKIVIRMFMVVALTFQLGFAFAGDLDSWSDGSSRQAILNFVKKATDQSSSAFIPKADRIAVFDNDGTLWGERPIPVQLIFALDRVKQLAPKHPEWKTEQPYKGVLEGDLAVLSQMNEEDIYKILVSTHAGMTQGEFTKSIEEWFKVAKDPKLGLLYTQRSYIPMVEMVNLLRANDFKVYISTGGGTEFVRGFAETSYGIPPEQVIGNMVEMRMEQQGGKLVMWREATIVAPINLYEGKAFNIQRIIGKAPVIAVGNSDGDLQMLQYADSSPHPSLKVVVRHDDATRETAYEEGSEKLLKEASAKKWLVVSMKKDFKKVFLDSAKQNIGDR